MTASNFTTPGRAANSIEPKAEWKLVHPLSEEDFFIDKNVFDQLAKNFPTGAVTTDKKGQEGTAIAFPEIVKAPIRQLSPLGLALISYLYALKDNNQAQPLIASDAKSVSHMIDLMDMAPAGTKVTIVFQYTEKKSFHKTTFKLEKYSKELHLWCLEGVNEVYATEVYELVRFRLDELNTDKHVSERTKLFYFSEEYEPKPAHLIKDGGDPYFWSQVDLYQCGVVALKVARELNKDSNFSLAMSSQISSEIKKTSFHGLNPFVHGAAFTYSRPAKFLKFCQSRSYAQHILKKCKSLEVVYQKYGIGGGVSGYVQHFSKKYCEAVKEFFKKHSSNPQFVTDCVKKYDAGKMSLERLLQVYAPKDKSPPENILSPEIDDKEKQQACYEEVLERVKQFDSKLSDKHADAIARNFLINLVNTENLYLDGRERLRLAAQKCAKEMMIKNDQDFIDTMFHLLWKNDRIPIIFSIFSEKIDSVKVHKDPNSGPHYKTLVAQHPSIFNTRKFQWLTYQNRKKVYVHHDRASKQCT